MARIKIYQDPKTNNLIKIPKGFNWWVLMFGPLWFFLNKIYLMGICYLLFAIAMGRCLGLFGSIIVWAIAAARAHKDKENKYLLDGWNFIGYEDELELKPRLENKVLS